MLVVTGIGGLGIAAAGLVFLLRRQRQEGPPRDMETLLLDGDDFDSSAPYEEMDGPERMGSAANFWRLSEVDPLVS